MEHLPGWTICSARCGDACCKARCHTAVWIKRKCKSFTVANLVTIIVRENLFLKILIIYKCLLQSEGQKDKTEDLSYLCACVLRMAVHVSQHARERIYLCINTRKMLIRPTFLKITNSDKTIYLFIMHKFLPQFRDQSILCFKIWNVLSESDL